MIDIVTRCICDIMDIEDSINQRTYLIRDLAMESVDLLELAVSIGVKFGIVVNDEMIFLKSLRFFLQQAEDENLEIRNLLQTKYPFLTIGRINEILEEIKFGPVLILQDVLDYIVYAKK